MGPQVDLSELHFSCSFQGYPTWLCLAHLAKYPNSQISDIWPYLAIWIFGKMRRTWPSEVSLKGSRKMQLSNVDLRSVGHSYQKLSQKIDSQEFHHVYPPEHLKWVAMRYLWVYKFEKKSHGLSFTHPKSCSERQSQNQIFRGHPSGQLKTESCFLRQLAANCCKLVLSNLNDLMMTKRNTVFYGSWHTG